MRDQIQIRNVEECALEQQQQFRLYAGMDELRPLAGRRKETRETECVANTLIRYQIEPDFVGCSVPLRVGVLQVIAQPIGEACLVMFGGPWPSPRG